ncbi:Geranylgeranyl diphosphate synthase [hydrothermal vent metagenome]|uniref:Geranylgeranyl diphosphate synthase n=1 Tax=hydrothermal vent metagenome TaxID=652676 RepID=A0A3B0UR18_9ZZZZ
MNQDLNTLLNKINTGLEDLSLPKSPINLYEPIKYILKIGGKRVRPMLAMLAYQLYKKDVDKVLLPILALEVFHNFTLVHDDIMDEAPLRRGNETVHTKWNRNIAILSGDVMMVKAYNLLSHSPSEALPKVLKKFNACAQEVCEGQQKDMDFEKLPSVTVEEYLNMIRQKTAVLLGFSLELGAILAGAPTEESNKLYEVGVNLGLAFQLQDDLLDLYGGDGFGKQIGGDIINKKKSILITKALELSNEKTNLLNSYNANTSDPDKKVKKIRGLFNQLGVQKEVKQMLDIYEKEGNDGLAVLGSANQKPLLEFITHLKIRVK